MSTSALPAGRTWLYLKLYPGRLDRLDAAVADVVGPFVAEHGAAASRWFFLRYHDASGPHIRLRLLVEPDVADVLALEASGLAAQLGDLPVLRPADLTVPGMMAPPGGVAADHGVDVAVDLYEPEWVKWGGAGYLPVAEQMFECSSIAALALLGVTRRGWQDRLAVAATVMDSTLRQVGLVGADRARFLAEHARWWSGGARPGEPRRRALESVAGAVAGAVRERRVEHLDHGGAARAVDDFTRALTSILAVSNPEQKPAYLVFHHLHLMLNRIGVSPQEEAVLSLVVAASAAEPELEPVSIT